MSETIEHVVLFKINPNTDPAKTQALLRGLRDLGNIERVLHLSAGPIRRSSTPPSLTFDLMLHSRYSSKQDLQSYMDSAQHQDLLRDLMFPICSEVMLLDWVVPALHDSVTVPPQGSVMRVTFYKLKEESDKEKLMELIGEAKGIHGAGEIHHHTAGENFTPKNSYGFSIASLAVFNSIKDLEGFDANQDVKDHMNKLKELVEDVVEVDYVL